MDALLLAAFAEKGCARKAGALLDLGTGCGVVALAFLLRHPEFVAVGVDVADELLDAARCNAAKLGLETRFAALWADLREGIGWGDLAEGGMLPSYAGSFACVTANPPYRVAGTGRLPASPARRAALFADAATVPAFVRAGEAALAPDGAMFMVFPLEREDDLVEALSQAGLFPCRMRRVLFHERNAAKAVPAPGDGLILLEAVKKAPDRITREEPLCVHTGEGTGARLTAEARDFCPWLGNDRPE